MSESYEYTYSGPVLNNFGMCLDVCWEAETYAPSEKKARNNLMYRFKDDNDIAPQARIKLPGKLTRITQKGE